MDGSRIMSEQRRLGPNAALRNVPGSRGDLATPALVLDLDALERNLATMARLCAERGLALRPHAKTHKSVHIAKLQVAAGALGVCVANLREAEVMAAGGVRGLHLTTPVVGRAKIDILVSLLKQGADLTIVVDSIAAIAPLEAALKRAGQTVAALVDIDVRAMYRTGVASAEDAVAVATALQASATIDYAGVQYYSGIVQHLPDYAERAAIYGVELDKLADILKRLEVAGLPARIVSGGGSGSFDLDAQSGLFTENQAGSYLFMDMEYGEVEFMAGQRPFDYALTIQGTVISNNVRGLVTVDVGAKAFATDGPIPRLVSGVPKGAGFFYFGDEFGAVLFEEIGGRLGEALSQMPARYGKQSYDLFHGLFGSAEASPGRLTLGAKVELLAPHCDPTVNLHDVYHCVRGDTLVDIWPVDARGSL
jgi:3-hydroxy-D-aspartate aldolase